MKMTDRLFEYGCKIIIVDDGSGEAYQPVFDRVKDICILLRHQENRGKGAALKTAFAYIQKEIWDDNLIGVMDCDGQHLPEDMMRLLEAAGNYRESMVLGVRSVGKEMPLKSRVGNRITRAVFGLVSGVRVSDTQTGLRAFDIRLIPRLLAIEGERYEYEMNVLMSLAREGVSIEEVPIHTIYRDERNSTSHFHVLRDSVRVYKDILKFALSSMSSFFLDYILFSVLMLCLPHSAGWVLAANITARIFSAYYNYSMNCRFVFHTRREVKTAANYFALAIFILTMNNLILGMFTQILGMSVYPAKLMTEMILFIVSWLIQNFMIFRKTQTLGVRA